VVAALVKQLSINVYFSRTFAKAGDTSWVLVASTGSDLAASLCCAYATE
jgi:hypothetical protein